MKPYNKILLALLFIGFLSVGEALAKGPLLRVILHITGTDGKPVHGALVTIQDDHEQSESALVPPRVRGSTNAQGIFIGEIETPNAQLVRLIVERNGYVRKRLSMEQTFTVVNGRWAPWEHPIKVVLTKFPSADPEPETDRDPPSIPAGLRIVKVTTDSITIKWNPAKDNVKVSGYLIYRNDEPVETSEPIRGSSFTDSNLPDDEEFVYEVRAFDFAGNLSHLSDPVLGKTKILNANGEEPKPAKESIPWSRPEN